MLGAPAVKIKLAGTSNNVEYRRMHHIWVSNGIICLREDVRKTAQQMILKGLHSGNADDFTAEGMCLQELSLCV